MSGTLELLVDGQKVKIDWLRDEAPTQADVDEIKNQIRSKRKPNHVAALSALGMSQGGALGRANQFVNSAVSKRTGAGGRVGKSPQTASLDNFFQFIGDTVQNTAESYMDQPGIQGAVKANELVANNTQPITQKIQDTLRQSGESDRVLASTIANLDITGLPGFLNQIFNPTERKKFVSENKELFDKAGKGDAEALDSLKETIAGLIQAGVVGKGVHLGLGELKGKAPRVVETASKAPDIQASLKEALGGMEAGDINPKRKVKMLKREVPIKEPVTTEPVETGAPVTVKEEFKKIDLADNILYHGTSQGDKAGNQLFTFLTSDKRIAEGYANAAGGRRTVGVSPLAVDRSNVLASGGSPVYEKNGSVWRHVGETSDEMLNAWKRTNGGLPDITDEVINAHDSGMNGNDRFSAINPDAKVFSVERPKNVLDLTTAEGVGILRHIAPGLVDGNTFDWGTTKWANLEGSALYAIWEDTIAALKERGYDGIKFHDDAPHWATDKTTTAIFGKAKPISVEHIGKGDATQEAPRAQGAIGQRGNGREEFKTIEPPSDATTPAETPEALQHRHADLDELASEFNLIPHEKSSVPWATYVRDATVMLNHPDVVEARILKAKPKAIDAATNVAGHQIVKTLGEKANQLEDAGMTTEAAAFRDRAQAIFDKLYEGGSEAGRRLNAQRMFVPQFDEHRLGKMVETLTEKPLDDVQKTVINKNVRKVNDLTNRAAGRARDLINENVPRMNKQVPPSGFFARNKHFTEQMVSDAAARLLRKGSQASANPFAPLLDIETYRDLTTIGGGLIEAGYRKVEDFAVQMRDVLKDTGISLTDQELLGLQLDALRAFSRKSNIPGSMWGEDIMTGKQGGEFWGLADPEIRNIRKEIDSVKSQTMAWINQQRRTGFFEGLRIGLRTNRLTNPVARVKDLIGNLSVQVERQAGKASIDPLIDRLLFPKNEQAVLGFSWKRAQEVIGEGWGNRIKDEVVQQLKHGDIDLLHKFSGRKELNTGHPKFDAAVNSVTRFAGVTDVPFKDWIFRETLNDLAELRARAEAKAGGRVKDKAFIDARRKYHFENPSDDMLLMAENESITGVFGGDNLFTEWNKALEAWLSRQGEKGQAIGLVKDLIVQFPNIFSNISGYVTDFGVGAFKAGGREIVRRADKRPLTIAQQRLVTKLVSRNLKGVALVMLGKYLYDNGVVNPTVNAKDGYVDWGDLGDTGGPFTVALYGATVAALDSSGLTDAQKQRIMWGTTVGLMADQPAIEGTGRALQAIRTQQGLVKYLSQTGSSAIVPSLIREWARRQDSVKTTGNIFERQNRKVESPQDAMKNVLPFLRETLPPK